jgi:hypothetical protein
MGAMKFPSAACCKESNRSGRRRADVPVGILNVLGSD